MPINAGPTPSSEDGMRAHMRILHGTYTGDVHDVAGLRDAHREQHADLDPFYALPHTHTAPGRR